MATVPTIQHIVGVGVGPGDPELVTLKAARVLREADAVLVPTTESRANAVGRAEEIVRAVAGEDVRIVRVAFSMGEEAQRTEARQASADAALREFAAGARNVAFATVGDPSVYSTFSYLAAAVRQELPDVRVSVVPGITAMQALAAASTTPLTEGREVLCLFPNTAGPERLAEVFDVADTVVIYKGGRKLPQVLATLRERGREAVVGAEVSLPEESITTMSPDGASDDALPYFSTVLSAPNRQQTGDPT